MTYRRSLLASLVLSVPASGALAHLPPGARGPNGGQVQNIGPVHGELLARDNELVLFLFDHRNRPLDARKADGTAVLTIEGRQQTLTFAPRPDGSALVATGEFAATPGLRVVVQIVPGPGMARSQARFTPVPAP